MDAIEMVENIATVSQDLCIGCGNCVVTCSEEAVTLKNKEKGVIPPNTTKDLFLKIMDKKAELRRKEKGVL
jgi:Fe-S-cluster-containing hydrogenase component 2